MRSSAMERVLWVFACSSAIPKKTIILFSKWGDPFSGLMRSTRNNFAGFLIGSSSWFGSLSDLRKAVSIHAIGNIGEPNNITSIQLTWDNTLLHRIVSHLHIWSSTRVYRALNSTKLMAKKASFVAYFNVSYGIIEGELSSLSHETTHLRLLFVKFSLTAAYASMWGYL